MADDKMMSNFETKLRLHFKERRLLDTEKGTAEAKRSSKILIRAKEETSEGDSLHQEDHLNSDHVHPNGSTRLADASAAGELLPQLLL